MSKSNIRKLSDHDEVRAALTEWLEQHEATVYWGEQADGYDQKTFNVMPGNATSWGNVSHRPDMLIEIDDHITVSEIKVGSEYGTIADGVYEIFDYWDKHHAGGLNYEADGKNYTPDSFTLATRYSPFGHIYPSEHEFFYENDGGYIINDKLPQFEANMSGVTLRTLWRFARSTEYDVSTGIGLLLSDLLENIDKFDSASDNFDMARASEIEEIGEPASFYWDGDQNWESF